MCVLLTLLAWLFGAAPAAGQGTTILVGGFVVNPGSAVPAQRADVLIRGNRIVAVGRRLRAPPGARRIDATGRYLVPGLWDMHAHVAAIGPVGDALEDYVRHGVLGIRDMGGRADEVLALRDAVAGGERLGPTIYAAGPTLNGAQGGDHHRLVRDEREGRLAARALAELGVDFIKVHRQTSREALRGILAEARARGLAVVGHAPLVLSWIEAADTGMRTIEHVQALIENELQAGIEPVRATFETLDRLDGARGEAIFAAMARNGTFWTPTLVFYENSWADDPPERRALKQRVYARLLPMVGRAARLGVAILAGTDATTNPRGAALLDELDRLVQAGLTPRQALAAATVNPFALTGRGPGPIRARGEASLLVIDGDPTVDIANLRRLRYVMLRGRLLDTPGR